MKSRINRRQLLVGTGAGAVGAAAALGAAPLTALASEDGGRGDLLGSWHVSVQVTAQARRRLTSFTRSLEEEFSLVLTVAATLLRWGPGSPPRTGESSSAPFH